MAARTNTAARRKAPSKSKSTISKSELTKGQLRKLTALRKSIGEEIAHKAFAEWLTSQTVAVEEVDKNAELYQRALIRTHGPIFGVRST